MSTRVPDGNNNYEYVYEMLCEKVRVHLSVTFAKMRNDATNKQISQYMLHMYKPFYNVIDDIVAIFSPLVGCAII